MLIIRISLCYRQPMFEARKSMSLVDHDAHHHRKQLLDAEGNEL